MNEAETEQIKTACGLFPFTNKRALYRAFMVLGAAYANREAAAGNIIPIGALFDAQGSTTPENVFPQLQTPAKSGKVNKK
jgi:hypothetical protein